MVGGGNEGYGEGSSSVGTIVADRGVRRRATKYKRDALTRLTARSITQIVVSVVGILYVES